MAENQLTPDELERRGYSYDRDERETTPEGNVIHYSVWISTSGDEYWRRESQITESPRSDFEDEAEGSE